MLNSRKMIYFLLAIIVILCIAIVCLSINFQLTKTHHNQKVADLNDLIVLLTNNVNSNTGSIGLSDDLTGILNNARAKIDGQLLSLQRDFAEAVDNNEFRA